MLEIGLEDLVFNVILLLLIPFTIAIVELKDLLYAIVVAGIESVLLAVLFYMLMAPDIAIVEIVVGVGVETALFVAAIARTLRVEEA